MQRDLARPICTILAVLLACLFAPRVIAEDEKTGSFSYLFVGNSLTYYNDLPAIVRTIHGAIDRTLVVRVDMLATGGGTLRERVAEPVLRRVLDDRRYDVVVLQDRSGYPLCDERLDECRESIVALKTAVNFARGVHVRPIWYATWSRSNRDQRGLSELVARTAADLHLTVADVGASFARAEAIGRHATLDDGHPSFFGSWLAGATIVRASLGRAISLKGVGPICGAQWQLAYLSASRLASQQSPPPPTCRTPSSDDLRSIEDIVNEGGGEDGRDD